MGTIRTSVCVYAQICKHSFAPYIIPLKTIYLKEEVKNSSNNSRSTDIGANDMRMEIN